jgi:CcmD family protein
VTWLFLGYSVVWAAIFLYVHALHRRQRALEQDLEAVKAAVDERRGSRE